MGSCEKKELVTLNSDAETITTLSTDNVVLTKETAEAEVLTVSWTEPDFGFVASTSYSILLDLEGGNFEEAQVVSAGTDLSKNFTGEALNKVLLSLGLLPDESAKVDVIVKVNLTDSKKILSEKTTITVTPYASTLDLTTTWGVVGSGANDWGATPDLPFYKTDQNGVLVAYVDLIDGEIKFRENNDWALNYGDTGADGILEEGGDNIAVTAGSYKIVLNLNDLTYTMERFTIGIVGSAYNDWGATPDAAFVYDPTSDQFRIIVKLLEGEMKFRLNNDWAVNYGDTEADGTLEDGGDNIATTAGYFIVTVNLNDLTYTMEEIDYVWGLVGSAYNDWGTTPDAIFTRDWANDDVWVLNNVTLLDGEFKIRANSDWGLNYGDTGNDGILEVNGDNIPSVAGTYNLTVDFSNMDAPIFTIE